LLQEPNFRAIPRQAHDARFSAQFHDGVVGRMAEAAVETDLHDTRAMAFKRSDCTQQLCWVAAKSS
jgi:hypothetical protein